MHESIKLVIKGFIIGLGKILPGVSGAVFAMMLNVYEPAIQAIASLKNNLYSNLKFLALLSLGILLSIVFGSNLLIYLFNKYYVPTMCLFLGIMLAGLHPIIKEIDKIGLREILFVLVIVFVFILISLIPNVQRSIFKSNTFMFFISGILDAFSSIVPGISGTVLLMTIGTYDLILATLANMFNINSLKNNLLILIPFFIGILLGIYLVSKVMNYLFKNHRNISYCCIMGLIIGSIVTLLFKIDIFNYGMQEIFISILFCIFGYIVTKRFNN